MTLASMFLFLLAYATAVAVPGPGLAALIARVLARGAGGVAPFIAGFIVGDLVWFAIAAAGMAALAETLGSSSHWSVWQARHTFSTSPTSSSPPGPSPSI
jgi:threonine/homoserine/homoserine lactone efflux protein